MLLFVGERDRASQLIFDASTIYKDKLGESHPSTVDVVSVASQIQEQGVVPFSRNGTGGGGVRSGGGGGVSGGMDGGKGITQGSVEGMQGYSELMNQFPSDMPRAATQSPIPLPPQSRGVSAGMSVGSGMGGSGAL